MIKEVLNVVGRGGGSGGLRGVMDVSCVANRAILHRLLRLVGVTELGGGGLR